mgnify:CR=1 FL=1
MAQVSMRFYAELNDFLPESRRCMPMVHHFEESTPVGEIIGSFGIPHKEIDLILVNDESVDLSYPLRDGDRVAVYPVFETFDISAALRVRRRPLRETRFVLDVGLGRLAWYLRLLGFDTILQSSWSEEERVLISRNEHRVLVTRDRTLIQRSQVTHGYRVRASRPRQQAVEVLRRFDLRGQVTPFRRCTRCNALFEGTGQQRGGPDTSGEALEKGDSRGACAGPAHPGWSRGRSERVRKLIRSIIEDAVHSSS